MKPNIQNNDFELNIYEGNHKELEKKIKQSNKKID